MKRTRTISILTTSLLLAINPGAARALSLLLDFGPTTVLPADELQSPGHAIGAVPASEVTWNRIVGDTNTLFYGDGAAATGVTLNLGRSTAGSDTIDFNDNGFSVSALGGAVNTGIYAGTSPVRDGVFGGSGGANNLAVGLRIDGLAAGTYTVFVHGRNTSTALIASLLFYGTNGPSATTYSFSTADEVAEVVNSSPPLTTGFVEGDNYGVLTVTLGAGESLYIGCEGTIAAEMRGFFNAIQVVAGVPVLPAKITAHPAGRAVFEGAGAIFFAGASGTEPLLTQWRLNGTNLTDGPDISGANSNRLTLLNVTAAQAGNYSLFVSNSVAQATSSNALLTVIPVPNTAQMSNIWTLLPFERTYLFTNSTERGIAYNAATTNLLLVSRNPAESVVVLDPFTGAEKHLLDVTGVGGTTPGVTLGLSMIGVAEDGVVFAGSLTISATSPPYNIYRWATDDPGNPPILVFAGDPAASAEPNLRWGDNLAVRGAGTDTQILIAPGTGTNVVLLRSSTGLDFQTEIPPAVIAVSGVPSGFAQMGLAFGPGTNTFWAKTGNNSLFLIEFDLNAGTGTVLREYPTSIVTAGLRGISANAAQTFLAGIVPQTSDTLRLFDISDLDAGPIQRDQEVFASLYVQNTLGGVGMATFGGDYVFAVDGNNGLKSFLIDTNYVPPVQGPFSLSIAAGTNDTVVVNWPTTLGISYQPQFKDNVSDINWTNLGNTVVAPGSTLSVTDSTTNSPNRIYRVTSP